MEEPPRVVGLRVRFLDGASEVREAESGGPGGIGDLGIDGGVSQVGGPGHAQSLHPSLDLLQRHRLGRQGGAVPRVGAGHGLQHEHGVAHGARDRPGVGQGLHDAGRVLGHPSPGRLEAEGAAEGGGDADRAGAVRPWARAPRPAATAAAAPPLEPPGVRPRRQGLWVGPQTRLPESPFHPSSGVFVLPSRIMPASRRRSARGASKSGIQSAVSSEPRVVRIPRVAVRSFSEPGMPARGGGSPAPE